MKKLILVTLLLSVPALSQSTDKNDRTNGKLNGRSWMGIPETNQLALILGFAEALIIANPAIAKDYFPRELTFDDVVKGVTRFYQEPENLRFPVSYALQIFCMKGNGATQAQVEAKMDEMRRDIKRVEDLLKSVK